MSSRTLALLVLAFGGASLLLLGIVAAPLLGLIPQRILSGPPAATIALDLSGQVAALQVESARLKAALAQGARDIAALEAQFAQTLPERSPPAPPLPSAGASAGAAGDPASAQRIATLEDELSRAQAAAREVRAAQATATDALAARDRAIAGLKRDLAAAEAGAAAAEAARRETARAAGRTAESAAAAAQAGADELAAARAAHAAETADLRARLQAAQAAAARAGAARTAAPPETAAPAGGAATAGVTTADPPAGAEPADAGAKPAAGNAAAAPDAARTVAAGVAAYKEGEFARAFAIWRPLADAGDPQAQFHVGALYYEGRGVARDLAAARRWLDRAVAGGSAPAAALIAALDGAPGR